MYNDYKNSGYSKKFKAENLEEITKFENAKQVYKELGKGEKFPTMDELKKEYAELNRQNSSIDFYEIQEELQTMLTAKGNLQTLLNIVPKEKETQEITIELKNKKTKDKTER